MATPAKEPQQDKEAAFGLPKAEFKPIAARGKQWFKVTTAIVGVVLSTGIGVVYWFFYHEPTANIPNETHAALEGHEIEKLASEEGFTKDNTHVPHQAIEQETRNKSLGEKYRSLIGRGDAKSSSASQAAQPHKGSMTRINMPQNTYYIVLSSSIDEDLALDYARQLASSGIEVTLIAPPPGRYYHWVALKQGGSLHEAHEQVKKLRAAYGADIWIIKY